MKTRNGFVSNSSSSSFIIMVADDAKKCPTCGHTPQSIVDIIKTVGYHSDDTSIELIEEYIRDNLDYERNSTASYIEELKMLDPNEPAYPNSQYTHTVAKAIENCKEELTELETQIAKYRQLEAEGKKLYHLQVSYHDNLTQHIFDENVESGIITIVEDWS